MNYIKVAVSASIVSVAASLPGVAGAQDGSDRSNPWYGVVQAGYTVPDASRDAQFGLGADLKLGIPLLNSMNLEISGFTYGTERESDDEHDFHHGLGLDVQYLLRQGVVRPFLIGGFGGTIEDVQGTAETYGYVNAGGGLLIDLPADNLSIRGDARYVGVFNDEIDPDKSILNDVRLSLGLQFAFARTEPEIREVPVAPVVRDADDDGVPDSRDRCPSTPAGVAVDVIGCPLDADGDGVVDAHDQCPGTPAGIPVGPDGCPADADGDGVADEADQCPGTPEGFAVDATGCVVEQTIDKLQGVVFEFNSERLTFNARRVLLDVANALKGQPDLRVEISGHTDSIGSEAYNLKLSRERAESVRQYLIRQGVDGTRLKAEGYGESSPVADNTLEAGRERNRRVEFKILGK